MIEQPQWNISVDEGLGVAICVLVGSFDLDTWFRVLEEFPTTPGFRPGISSLIDAREARLDFFHEDGDRLLAKLGPYLQRRGGGGFRSAWVVSSDVDFEVTRMIQTLLDELPIEAAVFREMDEAEIWVTRAPGPPLESPS